MELKRGIATNVRFSTEVSGGENGTSTNQVAILKVDNLSVEIKLPDSIIIEDGDDIVIVGNSKRGLFKALAYKNLATGVSGKGPVTIYMILGVIFSAVGVGTIPLGIGLIFAPVGMYMVYHSVQMSTAYNMVADCLE